MFAVLEQKILYDLGNKLNDNHLKSLAQQKDVQIRMMVRLSITHGPAQGKVFTFYTPDRFLFGSTSDARVVIKDGYVSRHHFLLDVSPPDCKIIDLDSKNGTYVNQSRYGGKKEILPGYTQASAKETFLYDGDIVKVGKTQFKIAIELQVSNASGLCHSCKIPPDFTITGEDNTLSLNPEDNMTLTLFTEGDVTNVDPDATQDIETPEAESTYNDPKSDNVSVHTLTLASKSPQNPQQRRVSLVSDTLAHYDFEVLGELGQGGMGIVYKARQKTSGKMFAIKFLSPRSVVTESYIKQFMREIEVHSQLKHRNIVQFCGSRYSNGLFFLALEFVDGCDLKTLMHNKKIFTLQEATPIMLGSLAGLGFAHTSKVQVKLEDGSKEFKGIVHRDLKPQNILLAKTSTGWIPKIADMGLAKSFEASGLSNMTKTQAMGGTPSYWPREQITHYKFLTPASDVFSIAVVFYEMLTNCKIRDGFEVASKNATLASFGRYILTNPIVPIQERNSDIPDAVAQVISKALQEQEKEFSSPEDMQKSLGELRYPDAKAFYFALENALNKSI